ncbi:hypothetical protein FRZ44_51140 [Hypericibacter terrae]|uniref:Uncharacterized protein n=1 Tax=Hypericibacter terrae TaxID=2602015 RepID=A0A5J6MR51_9PROT|nr:hypothetical protein FRZ44_51140 [Hypericibacter terrae]
MAQHIDNGVADAEHVDIRGSRAVGHASISILEVAGAPSAERAQAPHGRAGLCREKQAPPKGPEIEFRQIRAARAAEYSQRPPNLKQTQAPQRFRRSRGPGAKRPVFPRLRGRDPWRRRVRTPNSSGGRH